MIISPKSEHLLLCILLIILTRALLCFRSIVTSIRTSTLYMMLADIPPLSGFQGVWAIHNYKPNVSFEGNI